MKAKQVYLFNPDHDLALGNGDENFDAPRSARAFGLDVACLPLWYAEEGSVVLVNVCDDNWLAQMQTLFPSLLDISIDSQPDFSAVDIIHPWGWNAALRKNFLLKGAPQSSLPSFSYLNDVRRLSHRSTALRIMQFLHEDVSISADLPISASQLILDEVGDFAMKYPETVFKAPWSGSGKGLYWLKGSIFENAFGWCRKIVEKQGSVIGEQVYDKIQDFAMEFKCLDGMVKFVGYSLFETKDHGVYHCNILKSDHQILLELSKWISIDLLQRIQAHLLAFIEKEIAPFYSGYLGVDMFVYMQNDMFCLHPCVEINLRMTMGMVAHKFYNQFVFKDVEGRFYVDSFPASEDLLKDHVEREQSMPLKVKNGRIMQGYLSLSPIEKGMKYRVRVEII